MLDVKVLGPGCSNCQKVEAAAKSAVASMGVEAEITKVTDYKEIVELGIMATPGLIVNDEVVSSGRIPSETEIITWVVNALESN